MATKRECKRDETTRASNYLLRHRKRGIWNDNDEEDDDEEEGGRRRPTEEEDKRGRRGRGGGVCV
jgi:hypothetical protein